MSTELKEKIKVAKKQIRSLKKEIDSERKMEQWGALSYLCDTLEKDKARLAELEAEYKKGD